MMTKGNAANNLVSNCGNRANNSNTFSDDGYLTYKCDAYIAAEEHIIKFVGRMVGGDLSKSVNGNQDPILIKPSLLPFIDFHDDNGSNSSNINNAKMSNGAVTNKCAAYIAAEEHIVQFVGKTLARRHSKADDSFIPAEKIQMLPVEVDICSVY